MSKIAIIGGGISGLSIAQLLKDKNDITVYESDSRPGGLIKCERINGNLFHRTGGHVFNTKRQDVLNWFWEHFSKEEFTKIERNSVISLPDREIIPYPIENHVYMLNDIILQSFIDDMLSLYHKKDINPANFDEFLRDKFGNTLYNLYFHPYNYKIWRKDLTKVPLSWLEGKLPMPSIEEIMYNNIKHVEEKKFVHSSFFYPQNGGSQFIADRLAKNIDIKFNSKIEHLDFKYQKWYFENDIYDKVIFCGNIKQLPTLLEDQIDLSSYKSKIHELDYHGTTAVFCEIDKNDYSWIYMPDKEHLSHRIICTGNFSKLNNSDNKLTASIEFTDKISKTDIAKNLKKIPFTPKYLTDHYEKYTYPIQNQKTRELITLLKDKLKKSNFYLLGRFAEWEYYNMDAAIGAAIDLNNSIK